MLKKKKTGVNKSLLLIIWHDVRTVSEIATLRYDLIDSTPKYMLLFKKIIDNVKEWCH